MHRSSVSASVLNALGWSQTSQLIQNITGIQVPNRDKLPLQRYVQSRMQALGLQHESAYCDRLQQSYSSRTHDQEWTALLAQVTNGESYFFRDWDQLTVIRDRLLPKLIQQRRQALQAGNIDHLYLNLWSAGCSTGEEPYSLAILLKEALLDFPDWRIHLIATDINPQAIATARIGRYRDWAFRQTQTRYKHQYFRSVDQDWQIVPELRQLIQWDVLNLTQPEAIAHRIPWGSMDIILCRNVFIYFAPNAIAQTLAAFRNAMQNDGYLVVGHAELDGQNLTQFEAQYENASMVYQRAVPQKRGHVA